MGKLKMAASVGAGLKKGAGALAARVGTLFKKNPNSMADFAKGIPALAGKRVNHRSLMAYVRTNPLQSMLALSMIPEAVELVQDMYDNVPGLEAQIDASTADDTVVTLGDDREEKEQKRVASAEAVHSAVLDLPLKEVLNFRDEAQVIKQVIALLPGRSFDEQYGNLMLLRRVLSMPAGNFDLFNTLQSLGE